MPEPIEERFEERAERLAAEFNARYGGENGWTDEALERALADHGLPSMDKLPDTPQGMMRSACANEEDAMPSPIWRRVNASHLLGHVILHDGQRCNGCQDWGAS